MTKADDRAQAAAEHFDRQARGYDGLRRQLVPPFEAFYATAVAALGLLEREPERILDIGAGTGLLSRGIAEAHPTAKLMLLDAAPSMLREAREALGSRAAYVEADLLEPLPPGPWDAIVSALAIHHLRDHDKRGLLRRVHAALASGGIFVNAEQVAGPSPLFDAFYREWHGRRARELGATREDWRAASERMRLDRCATVEVQLAWLREAGFADVDCLFKDHRFAVMVARRARTRRA